MIWVLKGVVVGFVKLTSDDRMHQLKSLQDKATVTHSCPSCGGPVRCDIAKGKGVCWCFSVQAKSLEWNDVCLCKKCLKSS